MGEILLIDDWGPDLGGILPWLEEAGWVVELARSQEEAAEKARGGTAFDLLIVDIVLRKTNNDIPETDTLGGFRLMSRIPTSQKVLLLTRRGDKEVVERRAGEFPNAVGIAYKPLDKRQFVDQVRAALEGSTPSGSGAQEGN